MGQAHRLPRLAPIPQRVARLPRQVPERDGDVSQLLPADAVLPEGPRLRRSIGDDGKDQTPAAEGRLPVRVRGLARKAGAGPPADPRGVLRQTQRAGVQRRVLSARAEGVAGLRVRDAPRLHEALPHERRAAARRCLRELQTASR